MIRKSVAKKKIAKAQNGKAVADATRVEKSPVRSKQMVEMSRSKAIADNNRKGEMYAGYSIGSRGTESSRLSDSAHKYFDKADSIKKLPPVQKNGGKTPLKKTVKSVIKKSISKSKKK